MSPVSKAGFLKAAPAEQPVCPWQVDSLTQLRMLCDQTLSLIPVFCFHCKLCQSLCIQEKLTFRSRLGIRVLGVACHNLCLACYGTTAAAEDGKSAHAALALDPLKPQSVPPQSVLPSAAHSALLQHENARKDTCCHVVSFDHNSRNRPMQASNVLHHLEHLMIRHEFTVHMASWVAELASIRHAE